MHGPIPRPEVTQTLARGIPGGDRDDRPVQSALRGPLASPPNCFALGTGQGLSIAYALIVKKHSGKLRFESETGLGTTFFIEIPIDPAEHRSANAAAQS